MDADIPDPAFNPDKVTRIDMVPVSEHNALRSRLAQVEKERDGFKWALERITSDFPYSVSIFEDHAVRISIAKQALADGRRG